MCPKPSVDFLVGVIGVKNNGTLVTGRQGVVLWQFFVDVAWSLFRRATKLSQGAIPGAKRDPIIAALEEILQVERREVYHYPVAFGN